MSDNQPKPIYVRCFIANPGGAYDPAPLHDLDHEAYAPPLPGDNIADESRNTYVVKARRFKVSSHGTVTCALLVEEAADGPLDRV